MHLLEAKSRWKLSGPRSRHHMQKEGDGLDRYGPLAHLLPSWNLLRGRLRLTGEFVAAILWSCLSCNLSSPAPVPTSLRHNLSHQLHRIFCASHLCSSSIRVQAGLCSRKTPRSAVPVPR
ncbi:hypothetical protein K461DRAFT_28821 [Myriangium duriaei CBS 260.36]|uniref:Uncharacterized protein n=1 Tax=Myriangium duriaei CBS 260.36 TaxID=1168546 RepID=A0A9P4JEB8_9PEZI|nr:hypothetical protein K461DRAFT_28821 [Myriangium duriaei CBS 260.36]